MEGLKMCLLTTKEVLVKINIIWYHFHIFFKQMNSSCFTSILKFFFSITEGALNSTILTTTGEQAIHFLIPT